MYIQLSDYVLEHAVGTGTEVSRKDKVATLRRNFSLRNIFETTQLGSRILLFPMRPLTSLLKRKHQI